MSGPRLFVSLNRVDILQLPASVRLEQRALVPAALVRLCRSTPYQILWRGLEGHPNWHPTQGSFDAASALEIDVLDRQLAVLGGTGLVATYDQLASPAVSRDEIPPHWVAGGAHPINVGSVPSVRPFEAGDRIVLCDFKLTPRKALPLNAPAFHGNPGSQDQIKLHLKSSDMVPVAVSFRWVKLLV